MAEKEENTGWAEYGKLVLRELERLNVNYEGLRKDFDDVKEVLARTKITEETVDKLSEWKLKVDDVFSPTQMKEMKDEVYKQKNRWTAAIAIIAFTQVIVGVILSILYLMFNK